jgi:hypothetical protein
MDERPIVDADFGMGNNERPTCPKCGAHLTLSARADANGRRKLRCLDCDHPDPLSSDTTIGWIKGELQPPR